MRSTEIFQQQHHLYIRMRCGIEFVWCLALVYLFFTSLCQAMGNHPIFIKQTKAPNSLVFPPVHTRAPPPPLSRGPIHTPRPNPHPPVSRVVQEAIDAVNSEDATMRQRLQRGIDRQALSFDTPDPLLFTESPEDARAFSRPSRIINWIARLLKKYNMRESVSSVLSASRNSITCPFRPPSAPCDRYTRYRTIDGSCNNLQHPLWGAAFTPFVRLLPADYDSRGDRNDLARQTSRANRRRLPNARVISTSFHQPFSLRTDDSPFTMLLTVFGQFLSHDITDRAPTKGFDESVMKCCDERVNTPDGFCDNMDIPRNDTFRQFNRACLEFPRSLEVTDEGCTIGVREQLNQASSYIDGGAIYGATQNKSRSLRKFEDGLLLMSMPNELPVIPHGNVHVTTRGFAYFAIGDNRVNEFIGLIAMETVFAREHNRIARFLGQMNPHWNDEVIFQETRRIIVAVIQHITYSEYLPQVLGQRLIQKHDLGLARSGYFSHYDRNKNPGLANAFATASMRFGHSMLRTTYSLRDRRMARNGDTPIDLKDSFFRPQTYMTNEHPLVRGMATDPSKNCDRVLSGSIINNLYETDSGTGSDLAAANIQRGRDHGLPSYTEWRRHFGLSVPTRFDRSSAGFQDHDADTVRKLGDVYRDPADVDLFSGGVSEKPPFNAAVGPLFGEIIGQQFRALKKADRFWYETGNQPQAFTPGQLDEIRKITLARLMCDSFNFDTIQRRAFLIPSPSSNPRVSCGSIPSIKLDYWKSQA